MKQPALTPLCLYSGRWRSACLCLLERRGSWRSYETWRLWGGFLLHLQKIGFFLIFGQKRGLKWKEVLKYFKNLWDKLLLWQKQAYSLVSKSNSLHPPQRVKKLKWFSLHYSSWTKLIKCVVQLNKHSNLWSADCIKIGSSHTRKFASCALRESAGTIPFFRCMPVTIRHVGCHMLESPLTALLTWKFCITSCFTCIGAVLEASPVAVLHKRTVYACSQWRTSVDFN